MINKLMIFFFFELGFFLELKRVKKHTFFLKDWLET